MSDKELPPFTRESDEPAGGDYVRKIDEAVVVSEEYVMGPFRQVEDRITHLFYVLLRDHLPAGEVENIVDEICKARSGFPLIYSNPFVEMHARDIVKRLVYNRLTELSKKS